jgi:hypothetical protein
VLCRAGALLAWTVAAAGALRISGILFIWAVQGRPGAFGIDANPSYENISQHQFSEVYQHLD